MHRNNGLGLHFFDWSLNFLAGNSCIIDDPLTDKIAHQHQINWVHSPSDLEKYHTTNNSKILVLQACRPKTCSVASKSEKTYEEYVNIDLANSIQIIQHALEQEFRVILIDWAKQHWIIPSYQTRLNLSLNSSRHISIEEQNIEWMKIFFSDAEEQWETKEIWDQREMLALCMRPKTFGETHAMALQTHFNNKLDYITTDRLWSELDSIISEYTNIDPDKMQHWLDVYKRWQKVHDVKFAEDFKYICDDIVAARYRDLTDYNLTFNKEALLQHAMIYAYNLNFKTFGLKRFPSNTIDLHNLLEPNIHARDFVYQDL